MRKLGDSEWDSGAGGPSPPGVSTTAGHEKGRSPDRPQGSVPFGREAHIFPFFSGIILTSLAIILSPCISHLTVAIAPSFISPVTLVESSQ